MDFHLLAPVLLASGVAASAGSLDALRWESRVLLLVSSEGGAADAERQEAFLRGRERDLAERQMTVIAVRGQDVRVLAGKAPADLSADALRRETRVGDAPFVAVLIGLDGGVKWTSRTPTPLDEINAVIDAMPMRRAALDR